jgi:elongation factor 1-gamma
MDLKNFSIALTELKNALANLENHLKLRFYLVGHSLTLADVFLVSVLAQAFTLAIDKKTRDASLPNLTRYVTLAL